MLYILLVMGNSFGTGGCICGILICKVMKANVPEKIWIDPATDLSKLSGHIDNGSVEYTRTDVFVKKACDYINRHLALLDTENNNCMPEWLENFKKAMKL